MAKEKKVELQPDWRSWFWWYLWGILLIPLLGIGIYIIWRAQRTRKSIRYEIYDRYILSKDSKYTQRVDLADISEINVRQRWIDKKFNTGDILISSPASTIKLLGIREPNQTTTLIEHAVAAEKQRISELKRSTEPASVKHDPGTLDKLDYLTGLWQQGLISDSDFKQERKHFE